MVYVHWIFFALYVCIVVSAAVAVLMDNRQPAKTLAWLLVLIFLPVVGLVFYFFFGQNTRKERFISQQKTFAKTKPTAVAQTKRTPRTASVTSADGSDRTRTAQSSAFRHGNSVAARR